MGYFSKFSKMEYNGNRAVNLLVSVIPSRMNIDNTFVWQNHRIGDSETPESLAFSLYGDANLYWVILVTNNMVSPYTDWPISATVLEDFVTKKYGSLTGVHHYWDNQENRQADDLDESKYRLLSNSTLPFYIIPVSNMEHERLLNEEKRDILVVNPKYINQFIEVYNKSLTGKS